jgi:hypothetical protein
MDRPADHIIPQAQHGPVSCGQTSVAMLLTQRTGKQWTDMDVNAKYGFGLLQALQKECPKDGWHDAFNGGDLTSENDWSRICKPVLKAGWPLVAFLNGEFSITGHGHIVLLLSVDENGNVRFADPNGNEWGGGNGIRTTTVARILACPPHPDGKAIFAPTLPVVQPSALPAQVIAADAKAGFAAAGKVAPTSPISSQSNSSQPSTLKNIDPASLAHTPVIIPCETWGAAPAKATFQLIKPSMFVDHHMADVEVGHNRPLATSMAEATNLGTTLCRQCQQNHFAEAWADTGQHVSLTRDGLFFEGRHGSRNAILSGGPVPMGAQCEHYNDVSIGMENEGNYMKELPPLIMLRAGIQMKAWSCLVYDIDSHTGCVGHRDKCQTLCPGDAFFAILPALHDVVHDVVEVMRKKAHKVNGVWVL